RQIDVAPIELSQPDEKLRLGVVLATSEATELSMKRERIQSRDWRHVSCVSRDFRASGNAAIRAGGRVSRRGLVGGNPELTLEKSRFVQIAVKQKRTNVHY